MKVSFGQNYRGAKRAYRLCVAFFKRRGFVFFEDEEQLWVGRRSFEFS